MEWMTFKINSFEFGTYQIFLKEMAKNYYLVQMLDNSQIKEESFFKNIEEATQKFETIKRYVTEWISNDLIRNGLK